MGDFYKCIQEVKGGLEDQSSSQDHFDFVVVAKNLMSAVFSFISSCIK